MTNTPPNDVRNFVHKRLFKAAKGFVTSGFNPLSAVGGFLAPTSQPRQQRFPVARRGIVGRSISRAAVRQPTLRTTTARMTVEGQAQKARARNLKFGGSTSSFGERDIFGGDCGPLRVWDEVQGKCVFGLGDQPGRDDTPIGDTVMGRYGAGEVPGNHVINRAVCRRGMVLGNDGVCYNRTQISNKEREWPRGRRPLLTGGDMRAISTAARAGKRLEGATKRLQKIGLMKKPASRRSIAARHHAT